MAWTKETCPTAMKNPGVGKRKLPFNVGKFARRYTIEAVEEAVHIMRTAEKPSDRMKAIEYITERGYGKAPLKIEFNDTEDNDKKSEFELLFQHAAQRAVESLRHVPIAPPVEVLAPEVITPAVETLKNQLSNKAELALAAARAAGITVVEDRLLESGAQQHETVSGHTLSAHAPISGGDS